MEPEEVGETLNINKDIIQDLSTLFVIIASVSTDIQRKKQILKDLTNLKVKQHKKLK